MNLQMAGLNKELMFQKYSIGNMTIVDYFEGITAFNNGIRVLVFNKDGKISLS